MLSYDEETTCLGSLDFIRRFGADLLHVAGALKHQLIDGERELQRMLP